MTLNGLAERFTQPLYKRRWYEKTNLSDVSQEWKRRTTYVT